MFTTFIVSFILTLTVAIIYYLSRDKKAKNDDYKMKLLAISITTFVISFVGQTIVKGGNKEGVGGDEGGTTSLYNNNNNNNNNNNTASSIVNESELGSMLQFIDTNEISPF
tara:strand:- start:1180 stop:1512 length:333 start_codon:yes stop_codon:yes gene_type:complete